MATIVKVKVWNNGIGSVASREYRLYVQAEDGREGCAYLTGNRWHKPGSTDGHLTNEEWQEARQLSFRDGTWYTYYAPTSTSQPMRKSSSISRCPDCGEIEGPSSGCGGGYCGAELAGNYR